ncbi:hypothetical protein L211DRAFT_48757 [Terfezia boudieri ATCC MYA-4762]|uniref:Uncharacterized protein n=1 Tax=Terfezia boudieri ATCC MYA-4762 TaxID=1051890 RepID=A0A3N4M417_9PEZI|nr:hypothetical protein L211DRAFT_48757 [Terfezia boudieri ATCC MYA-4762]
MSFFSRFQPAGTTAITKQDIKVKTVKVPATHPLPILSHPRPSTPRTASAPASCPSTSSTAKAKLSKPITKSNLLSPHGNSPTNPRGRESKPLNSRDRRSTSRDFTRDRSLKRKESSSSFQRLDSPSTTTSSLRSVSPSNDSVTSHTHTKKRRLTPSAPHHRNSPIQERLVSSDEDSDVSEDGTVIGSREEKLRREREAKELGLLSRNYLNPKSFKSERMSFVHADQIANLKKEGYRRGISWNFFSFSFSGTVGFVLV